MCQNKINSIIKICLAKTFWKKIGRILLVLALLGFSQLLVLSASSLDLFRYMLPITLPSKIVFVDEMVILKSNKMDEPVNAADDSEEGRKWAEYLKNLSSDDFGKYKV